MLFVTLKQRDFREVHNICLCLTGITVEVSRISYNANGLSVKETG
jgi:hypothetical protein